MVEAGYQPELECFEACNKAKLIMNLICKSGFTGMLKAVSKTANYGGLIVGPKVVDEHAKENMRKVVKEVKNGEFAREWIKERETGEKKLNALIRTLEEHQIEKAGKFIRKTTGMEK